ncbi:hypothetical protein L596_025872 [Steinernema carpocapsae]|uniref:Chromo domain-containing protein n=1 Tax=Steinernema carpocapsae TaxID=34508 RepID=A0A4U5M903_STECR|nr:hypothetical protein L596_025872 [Steinernema carpocapsae]
MSDSGSAESRPASAQDSYIVERIEAKRRNRKNGVMEYFIKWKNFPVSENSWEPEENCQECEEAIADFERREAEKRAMKRAAARNRGRGSALSAPATLRHPPLLRALLDLRNRVQAF